MSIVPSIKGFFQTRDELSLSNIRKELWPLLIIFPLTVILGDFRYFNLKIEYLSLQSYELMLYPLGLGWLAAALLSKKIIFTPLGKQEFNLSLLKIAAVCCAAILPFQLLLTDEMPKLASFMAFQFFNGVCAGCAFSIFCFKLNNIERLFGMAMILVYYGLYYIFYRQFPAVQAVYKLWGGIAVMAFYLVTVFLLDRKLKNQVLKGNEITENIDEKSSKVGIIILLHIVYYSIMCMINYIEVAEKIIFSLPYGLGQFTSILMIALIMVIVNRNPLHIWLMFLAFSLMGLIIVNYDSKAAHFAGSLVYGFGDGLGYIIIYYLCSGAIKKSNSIKMYKLFCFILFIEYFFISGVLSQIFDRYEGSSHFIAITIVGVLSAFCLLILPYLQKKLFTADWTDGRYLKDMPEYSQRLAETNTINAKENLDLTEREYEIFTLLLDGMSPKDIGYTLKISTPTVYFHRGNLFDKLGVKGITELFSKYGKNAKNDN